MENCLYDNRETAIAANAAIAMRVYKKLETENRVYSEDYVDLSQLVIDCARIAIECINTCMEYGWTETVTDFIESKLLKLYGINK